MEQDLTEQLSKIFGFTYDDLLENQAGRLSPSQIGWLKLQLITDNWLSHTFKNMLMILSILLPPKYTVKYILAWLVVVTVIGSQIITLGLGIASLTPNPQLVCLVMFVFGFMVAFWFLAAITGGGMRSSLAVDAENPTLNVVVGIPVVLPPQATEKQTFYAVKVAGWELALTAEQYTAFQHILYQHEGQELAFFFLPYSKRILTVSKISLDASDYFVDA